MRAALLKGRDAIDGWKQWAALVDYDDIDFGSQRLLPLLYQNLLDHKVKSPQMARYKGFYRRFWMKNQFLFNRTKPVLSALHKAGVKVLLFKGAGLIVGSDSSYALRPMDDIDFIIQKEDVQTVLQVIKELGWKPTAENVADFGHFNRAVMYHDTKGHNIDLHIRSLSSDMAKKQKMGEYWQRSSDAELDAIPVKIMGITDQLIHACVHGIRWNPVPPIRWIADAVIMIRNTESTIEWDHLVTHSIELQVTLPMFHGLHYLKREFKMRIPDYVLQTLENEPVSHLVKWYYQLSVRKPFPVFYGIPFHTVRYFAFYRKDLSFPGFIRYFQHLWRLNHLWQVPLEATLRMWRRLRIDLFKQNPASIS